MSTRGWVTALPLIAAVASIACSEAPRDEVNAAAAAMESAVAAGAPEHAPEAFAQAQQSQAALAEELAAQERTFVLFRSYGQARALAEATISSGQTAADLARSGEHDTTVDTEALVAQARGALAEVSALLDGAPSGKGSAPDLAALRGDLEGIAEAVADAEAAIADGRLTDARSKALAALEATEQIERSIEQARRMTTASG